MGYKLCTAEKPSAASDIAMAIGATNKRDGYYEGNGYLVTWAYGHLVGLAEPEEYGFMPHSSIWDKENSDNKIKALAELPLVPNEFKLVVLESSKKQFNLFKELMNRDDVDLIIDCGDAGSEGHILQWLIRQKARTTKPVLRFLDTSLTKESILKAMDNLMPIDMFKGIVEGEYCKKKADWIYGMSFSRLMSITYNSKIDVGRVQSPTLYFVLKRYLESVQFKPHDYYGLKITLDNGVVLFWDIDNTNIFTDDLKDSKGRLLNSQHIELLKSSILGRYVTITQIDEDSKSRKRPNLYNLSDLQKDANKYYGFTASATLEAAQELYERKILSYPRTDSKFITTDVEPYLIDVFECILNKAEYKDVAESIFKDGIKCRVDNHIVNDNKVTDHHALIVTKNINNVDMSKLSGRSLKILHLVISRMLLAVSFDFTYKIYSVMGKLKVDNNTVILSSSVTIPQNLGYKEFETKLLNGDDDDTMEMTSANPFTNLSMGECFGMSKIDITKGKTKAPEFHSERTLLIEMERAGGDKGIGTQATRGEIIKSLVTKGYVRYEKKARNEYIIPTKVGVNIIKSLPPELFSPNITADWEHKINLIAKGELSASEFMNGFLMFVNAKVNDIKSNKKDVDFSDTREIVAKCPFCKSDVAFGVFKKVVNDVTHDTHLYYCTTKECKFSIAKENEHFKMRTGRNFTSSQIINLIEKGSIVSVCNAKNGNKYDGLFKLIKNQNGYAQIQFEFAPKSKKRK
jgi:DNA topoisomerase-3